MLLLHHCDEDDGGSDGDDGGGGIGDYVIASQGVMEVVMIGIAMIKTGVMLTTTLRGTYIVLGTLNLKC